MPAATTADGHAAEALQEAFCRLFSDTALAGNLLLVLHDIAHPDVAPALAGLAGMLDHVERSRLGAYVSGQARDEFLLGRVMIRMAMAMRLGVKPAEVSLLRSASGKPEVSLQMPMMDQAPAFNLSHSGGVVALALAPVGALGLDLETSTRGLDPSLVQRYFAAEEVALMMAEPAMMQERWARRQWTMKEAYLKALGVGLGKPLDGFSILPGDQGWVVLDSEDADAAGQWRLLAGSVKSADWSICHACSSDAPALPMDVRDLRHSGGSGVDTIWPSTD